MAYLTRKAFNTRLYGDRTAALGLREVEMKEAVNIPSFLLKYYREIDQIINQDENVWELEITVAVTEAL